MLDALERRMNKRFEFLQMVLVVLATVEILHMGITTIILVKLL